MMMMMTPNYRVHCPGWSRRGCPQGAGQQVEPHHARLAAADDVRLGPGPGLLAPQPRDPEQVAARDGHLQLHAVQPAVRVQGGCLGGVSPISLISPTTATNDF